VIVAPDANIKAAARGIAIGRFWNCGQMCLGGKRLYVFEEVYDELMEQLTRTVAKYEPGLGWEKAEKPAIRVGPLHSASGRAELLEQLQDALDTGGELVLGGEAPEGPGFFMQPTIVANPAVDGRVAREETFGPVLPVWKVSDLDEAIALANDSEYGLGASVWTNDIRIINRVANEVEAGMKWVNQFHYGYDELPFGGVKQSGYGKEHGMEGLDYYLEDISVVIGGLE
jgi:succinate-semialdehyde dehydrogenase/glutarate-semialdehyde dehydrogenase